MHAIPVADIAYLRTATSMASMHPCGVADCPTDAPSPPLEIPSQAADAYAQTPDIVRLSIASVTFSSQSFIPAPLDDLCYRYSEVVRTSILILLTVREHRDARLSPSRSCSAQAIVPPLLFSTGRHTPSKKPSMRECVDRNLVLY